MKAKVKGINLLPKEYIQAEKVRMIQMLVGGILMLEVFAFIGGVAIPPKLEAKRVQVRLDDVSLKLNDPRFADVNKTIQALEGAKVEVEEWVAKYGNLKQENFISTRVLDSLTARLPIGMAIDKISISPGESSNAGKAITIAGSADQIENIISYVTLLEGVFGTGTVYYEGTYSEELDVYKFNLDVEIHEKVEALPEATDAASTPPTDDTTNNAVADSVQQTEGGSN